MARFARADVLDDIVGRADRGDWRRALEQTAFVCTQHLLETTGTLVEALLAAGARPERVFVQGKCYSTCPSVLGRFGGLVAYAHGGSLPDAPGGYPDAQRADLDRLARAAAASPDVRSARRLVVLDDGGRAIDRVRRTLSAAGRAVPTVAVEQTTYGVGKVGCAPPAVILVARSAVKTQLEPPMIADAVVARSPVPLAAGRRRCGVVGVGHIGAALVARLLAGGHDVTAYDVRRPDGAPPDGGPRWAASLTELVERSEVVFGCTGIDVSRQVFRQGLAPLGAAYGVKYLASCSSGDQEFRTLVRLLAAAAPSPPHPLAALAHVLPNRLAADGRARDAFFPHASLEVVVPRGGFPVNFDGSPESVPGRDIQLTRGLLLGALLQASRCDPAPDPGGSVTRMLDPGLQRYVVGRWRAARPLAAAEAARYPDLGPFGDPAWLARHSHGRHVPCPALDRLFREPTGRPAAPRDPR